MVVVFPDESVSYRAPVSESIHQCEPSSHQFTMLPNLSGSSAVHEGSWTPVAAPQEVKLNKKAMMASLIDVRMEQLL